MRKQVTAALALILGLCCLLVGCTPPEEQKIEIGRPQNVQQAGEVPVDLTGEDAERAARLHAVLSRKELNSFPALTGEALRPWTKQGEFRERQKMNCQLKSNR